MKKETKMKNEFKFNNKNAFNNDKKKYPGAQTTPKNNIRVNRSGRGN